MTLPVILGIAVGGILLVVLMTYVVWGGSPAEIGDEAALNAKLEHEYPGHTMADLLIAADRLMALARDETTGHYLIFYSHGIHVNIRSFKPAALLSCQVLQNKKGVFLVIHIDAFDRGYFALSLGDDHALIDRAHEWEEHLRGVMTSHASTTQE